MPKKQIEAKLNVSSQCTPARALRHRSTSLQTRWRGTTLRLFVALAALVVSSCAEPPRPAAPSLLLITIDTLRADHLGAWGYERATSPSIDRLAREAVVFENAYAHSSWTLPSLASLMTSTYTSTHACWTLDSHLRPSFVTLAERLADAGYATAGIASHVFLARKHGLHQGFQHYDEELIVEGFDAHMQITSPQVTQKAIDWLESRRDSPTPFFLWVHYFDPHGEYLPHGPHAPEFGAGEPVDLYDGEIAFTDRAIGRLIQHLDASGLGDETVVVLTSDHGEEFGEHGGERHGKTLFGEVTRVPLLIRAPGVAARRLKTNLPSVDILPTVLDLLGQPVPPGIAGHSALGSITGVDSQPRPIFTELKGNNRRESESLIVGRWKLVRYKEGPWPPILFDLETDPGETQNAAQDHPEMLRQLIAEIERLAAQAEEQARSIEGDSGIEMSPDELERLRQLGYVQDES